MLKPEERQAIQRGSWEIDCPRMSLRRCQDGATPVSGAGQIRLDPAGMISFKLYAPRETRPGVWTSGGSAGTVIPKEEFSTLEAWDSSGREWSVERLLPSELWVPDLSSVVLSGNIDVLVHRSEYPTRGEQSFLRLLFFDDVEIPCNQDTHSEISVAGAKTISASKMNVARFSAANHDFLLEKRNKTLSVEVTAAQSIAPQGFNLRITEALQFVLARSLWWSILERLENGHERVEIRRLPSPRARGRLPRPLVSGSADPNAEVWSLFDRYLQYVLPDPSQKWHPLSHLVHSCIEASAGSWEALALTLGVSVEGVLRLAFPQLCEPPLKFREGLATARQMICRSDLSADVRQRVAGAIGAMAGFRAQQGLEALAEAGAVKGGEVQAWKDLRHKSAHADRLDSVPIQEFIDLTYRLTVLFYRLIFTAIRYEGYYNDYGERGWFQLRHRLVATDALADSGRGLADRAEPSLPADAQKDARG